MFLVLHTQTSVWNEKMDDKYCLVKEMNRCNGIGHDISSMCIAHRRYDLNVPLFLGTSAVAEQTIEELNVE